MPILNTDVKFYKATNNNDTLGNGGRISSVQVVDNTLNNLFPNTTAAERVAGKTRYRKQFIRNRSVPSGELENTKIWVGARSLADDYYQLHSGIDTDTQTQADDYTDWCGAGLLNEAVESDDTSLMVTFDTNSGVFSGESVYVRVDDGTNNVEVQVIGTPSWTGEVANITIIDSLRYNFAVDSVVSTIIDFGTIGSSSDNWTEVSSLGTYDETTYPPVLYNVGTITDTWTFTFTDATHFSVQGSNTGSLASGEVTADYQPVNSSSYYFKINKNGWGGTWAVGETISFNTVHSGKGMWVKQVVPAGISGELNNVVRLNWKGESPF